MLSPSVVVVLDNLYSHKGKAARAIVRAKGVGGQGLERNRAPERCDSRRQE